jgi:UDP-3-O-[3-hydroxymyristoyl] N-acetylglucosamine deacetylase
METERNTSQRKTLVFKDYSAWHLSCIHMELVMRQQRTIKRGLVFKGTGLHTGKPVAMRLNPAPRDNGVVFYRSDRGVFINATVSSVKDTAFATTLGFNGTRIRTVEHVLAALSGLGIDNLLIEVQGPEVPILDGSSVGFVERIIEAGISRQASSRPYIKAVKPVHFRDGHAEIALLPHEGRRLTYQIAFDHALLGEQKMSLELDEESFARELAPARTFGFLKDVEYLRSQGLALGGSLDNAVLISERGVLNSTGLRFKDEFIRHKMLDFIGDISLSGFPIHGHFVVNRSGHTANTKFLKHFLSSPDCWQMVTEVEQSVEVAA